MYERIIMKNLFPYILLTIIFIIQIFDKSDDFFTTQIILVIIIIIYLTYYRITKKLDKTQKNY